MSCVDGWQLSIDSVDIPQRPRPDWSSACSIVLARIKLKSYTAVKVNIFYECRTTLVQRDNTHITDLSEDPR